MKRSIAILLLLAMILGVFAGCGKQVAQPTEEPTAAPTEETVPGNAGEDLAAAAEYLKTYYKDALTLTGRDYTRLGAVRVGLDEYPITWSVNVSEDVIKIVVNDDGTVTIDIADGIKEETPYVLTATLTDANGNVETVDFEYTIPASLGTMQEIVDLAYALENGAAMDQEVTLTGEIISVNTPYDAGYKNVTVTIKVAEREDFPIMCYRLKGEGADTITVGDTITVTGIIKNYNGTIEFDAGCVLEEVVKGNVTFDIPTDPKEIVDMAYALGVGESIPVKVTLTGKVTEFKETYTEQYKNISVWMAIEGRESKPVLAYRLKGDEVAQVAVGDTITVSGSIVNYKGTIEFNAGCTLDSRVSGGGKPPEEPQSNFWSTVPVVGETYYLFMDINGVNYYFTGKMSGNYLATSPNSGDAVEVTVEQSNGYGYRFYFMDGGVKKYIEIYEYTRTDGKNRGAVRIVEEPTVTFYWSGKAHTYTVYGGITNDLYFLGTYGTYTTFSVSSIYYITGNNAPNAGVTQYIADLMKPEDAPAPEEPPVVPETPSTLTFVDAPVAGTAYKFAMKQNGISGSPVLGITGEMSTYYYATTETEADMVDVYLEETTGGYHIYFMNGNTKTYLDVIPRSNDATKTNVVFQTSGEHSVYTLNTEFKYVKTTVNDTDWYLGTYGTNKTISASKTSYIEDTSKIGVSQFCAWFATAGEGGGTTPEQPEQPTVPTDKVTNGAKVVIYNPANNMALSSTAAGYYSAGVAVTITDGVMTGYGDTEVFTVTINADGTYTFTNGGKNFGMGDSFSSTSMGGVNDKWEVTDLGGGLYLLKNSVRGNYLEWYASKNNWSTYNSSSAATDPLYQQSFYIVEAGESTEPEQPEQPEEPEVPATLAEQIAQANGLANGEYLSYTSTITGTITDEPKASSYTAGSYKFTVSDGTNSLQCYYVPVTGGTPAKGDKVTVTGKLTAFNGNAQFDETATATLDKSTEPEQPEEPEKPTEPVAIGNGDKVVIYNPANNMALSSTAAGYYSAGVAITINDGVMTGYGDTEVFTVTINADGTYTFTNGGKNFGMGDSFSSTSMGGVNDKWEVTDLGNGLYLIKNSVRGNYLEWYASKNNWSTYNSASAATDPLYQQSFYIVEAGESTEPEVPEVNKDEEAAKAVDALIDAIGTVTKDSEAAIKAARDAYNALTDAQKKLVTKLAVLEAAEKALEELNKPAAPANGAIYVMADYVVDGELGGGSPVRDLDSNVKLTISTGWITGDTARIYKNANAVIESKKPINSIVLNAGYKDSTFDVYTSEDGETWTKHSNVAYTVAYSDVTINFETPVKYIKLDAVNQQIRIKTITVTFAEEKPAEPTLLATFTFPKGTNTTWNDGKDMSSATATYTAGNYSVTFSNYSKMYAGGWDPKSNGFIKFGTGSAVGSLTFTVPENVEYIELHLSGYKAKTSKYTINGGSAVTLTKSGNDGEWDVVKIDTTENKTITIATVSGASRMVMYSILFYGTEK